MNFFLCLNYNKIIIFDIFVNKEKINFVGKLYVVIKVKEG